LGTNWQNQETLNVNLLGFSVSGKLMTLSNQREAVSDNMYMYIISQSVKVCSHTCLNDRLKATLMGSGAIVVGITRLEDNHHFVRHAPQRSGWSFVATKSTINAILLFTSSFTSRSTSYECYITFRLFFCIDHVFMCPPKSM